MDSFQFLTEEQVRDALSKITGLGLKSSDLDKVWQQFILSNPSALTAILIDLFMNILSQVVQDYEVLASSLVPQKKRTSKQKWVFVS